MDPKIMLVIGALSAAWEVAVADALRVGLAVVQCARLTPADAERAKNVGLTCSEMVASAVEGLVREIMKRRSEK